MHLRFNTCHHLFGHDPKDVIIGLGITYKHATPQSMGDDYWFWLCENIPAELPSYLSEVDADPMECIGHGLTEEEAIHIASLI